MTRQRTQPAEAGMLSRFNKLNAAYRKRRDCAKRKIYAHINPDHGGAVVVERAVNYRGQPYERIKVFNRNPGNDRIEFPWRVTEFNDCTPDGKPLAIGHMLYRTLDDAVDGVAGGLRAKDIEPADI